MDSRTIIEIEKLDESSIYDASDDSSGEISKSFDSKDATEVRKELKSEEKTHAHHISIGLFRPIPVYQPIATSEIKAQAENKEEELCLDCYCFGFYKCTIL